jgi:hypothetical protein
MEAAEDFWRQECNAEAVNRNELWYN